MPLQNNKHFIWFRPPLISYYGECLWSLRSGQTWNSMRSNIVSLRIVHFVCVCALCLCFTTCVSFSLVFQGASGQLAPFLESKFRIHFLNLRPGRQIAPQAAGRSLVQKSQVEFLEEYVPAGRGFWKNESRLARNRK